MNDLTTVTGVVATTPKHYVTAAGVAITTFRLASGQRRFDKGRNTWVDGDTNWYTVTGFRHLAFNLVRSINKGDHVLVTGRLRVRNWEKDDRRGTSMDLEADAVGHDLFWCTTIPVKSAPSPASVAHAATDAAMPDREEEQPVPALPVQALPVNAMSVNALPEDALPEDRPLATDGFLPARGNELGNFADVDS